MSLHNYFENLTKKQHYQLNLYWIIIQLSIFKFCSKAMEDSINWYRKDQVNCRRRGDIHQLLLEY